MELTPGTFGVRGLGFRVEVLRGLGLRATGGGIGNLLESFEEEVGGAAFGLSGFCKTVYSPRAKPAETEPNVPSGSTRPVELTPGAFGVWG